MTSSETIENSSGIHFQIRDHSGTQALFYTLSGREWKPVASDGTIEDDITTSMPHIYVRFTNDSSADLFIRFESALPPKLAYINLPHRLRSKQTLELELASAPEAYVHFSAETTLDYVANGGSSTTLGPQDPQVKLSAATAAVSVQLAPPASASFTAKLEVLGNPSISIPAGSGAYDLEVGTGTSGFDALFDLPAQVGGSKTISFAVVDEAGHIVIPDPTFTVKRTKPPG